MSTPRIPHQSKLRNSKASDSRRALEIDQLIADINEVPKVPWPSTALGAYVLGGPVPSIVVNRDSRRNRDVVDYFNQFPNVELAYVEYLENCQSFAKRAGILAGATNPEIAHIFWFDCLFQCVPRFPNVTKDGEGWIDNFPAATIQLLQRLKRSGTMSGLTAATLPARSDQTETAGQETFFDLNSPPTEPYVYQPFPTTVYHHATRRNKVVPDQEALDAALAEGWKHTPPPSEPPPVEIEPAAGPPAAEPLTFGEWLQQHMKDLGIRSPYELQTFGGPWPRTTQRALDDLTTRLSKRRKMVEAINTARKDKDKKLLPVQPPEKFMRDKPGR